MSRHTISSLGFVWSLSLGVVLLPVRALASEFELPWRQEGLTERQAAAFLLDRFGYGARPDEIDEVVALSPGLWLESQLQQNPHPLWGLDHRQELQAFEYDPTEIVDRYSWEDSFFDRAVKAGVVNRSALEGEAGIHALRAAWAALDQYAQRVKYYPGKGLRKHLLVRKLRAAVGSEAQLLEMMTNFWFNHFNVSRYKSNHCALHVVSYERDAIREHALGRFEDLLLATAKHPAMLLYLDNDSSEAEAGVATLFDLEYGGMRGFTPSIDVGFRQRLGRTLGWRDQQTMKVKPRSGLGINENYARELLELHTLGVDGGYSQRDVVEVARAFSGWGVMPLGYPRQTQRDMLIEAASVGELGFHVEDEFVFRADKHDAEPKQVLGLFLDEGRGIEDGLDVIQILAEHPATIRRLATKLARRFVADDPPDSLIGRVAESLELTGGDLREAVRTLASSSEFWQSEYRRTKVKSPFELAVSTIRILDAEVVETVKLNRWIGRLGQNSYEYGVPTGYPDRGETWTSASQVIGRINFVVGFAMGRIEGVNYDPLALIADVDTLADAGSDELISIVDRQLVDRLLPEREVEELLGALSESRSAVAELPQDPDLRRRELIKIVRSRVGTILSSPDFQRR